MNQHVFLFGGSPPFGKQHGEKFAQLSQQKKGHIAILCLNRKGWQAYMPKYQMAIEEHGMKEFRYYLLEEKRTIGNENIAGIIICGGHTLSYHRYIVGTQLGEEIKQFVEKGVPLAGFSAGALICANDCMISPNDHEGEELIVKNGLGIVMDYVIAVHYTKWSEKKNLLAVMHHTETEQGLGLDEHASVYLKNGHIESIEGNTVHILRREEQ